MLEIAKPRAIDAVLYDFPSGEVGESPAVLCAAISLRTGKLTGKPKDSGVQRTMASRKCSITSTREAPSEPAEEQQRIVGLFI
jgi:hypothetical protein